MDEGNAIKKQIFLYYGLLLDTQRKHKERDLLIKTMFLQPAVILMFLVAGVIAQLLR